MRRVFVGLALLSAAIVLTASPAGAKIVQNTVGPTAALIGDGHVAKGTVLLERTAGQQVQFTLTLTQDYASGTGQGAGVCTGAPTAFEVTVPARGENTFTAGAAAACATAVNRARGVVDDTKQWCRAGGITLSGQ